MLFSASSTSPHRDRWAGRFSRLNFSSLIYDDSGCWALFAGQAIGSLLFLVRRTLCFTLSFPHYLVKGVMKKISQLKPLKFVNGVQTDWIDYLYEIFYSQGMLRSGVTVLALKKVFSWLLLVILIVQPWSKLELFLSLELLQWKWRDFWSLLYSSKQDSEAWNSGKLVLKYQKSGENLSKLAFRRLMCLCFLLNTQFVAVNTNKMVQ